MTQAISSAPVRRFGELRLVMPICAAHFVSHYYMIILAPLFAFIQADYRLTYTELALALTAFNVVSAALQTPAGFLVDRVGARVVLIAGLALGTAAFAVAGLVDSYAVFVAMFAVAGLGNTAYHPADYSLLSQHTPPNRIGQVFSFHTFAGILGSAVAPATLLAMQSQFGPLSAPPSWVRRCWPCSSSNGRRSRSALRKSIRRNRRARRPRISRPAGAYCFRRRSCSIWAFSS